MFGLDHCIYYECVMNGSDSIEESDSQPLFLCPICLRKLQKVIKFDFEKMYISLLEFFEKYKFEKETEWIKKRLKMLNEEK